MATKLPKLQGRREKNYQEFWHAKNEGEKKGIGSQVKRKGEKLICGNGIAENGRKKKRIVAMELPKIGERKLSS